MLIKNPNSVCVREPAVKHFPAKTLQQIILLGPNKEEEKKLEAVRLAHRMIPLRKKVIKFTMNDKSDFAEQFI